MLAREENVKMFSLKQEGNYFLSAVKLEEMKT